MNMLYAMVGAVFMVGMGVFAFLKGDNPERIGAGAYLMAWFASVLTQGGMGASNIPYAMFALGSGPIDLRRAI